MLIKGTQGTSSETEKVIIIITSYYASFKPKQNSNECLK